MFLLGQTSNDSLTQLVSFSSLHHRLHITKPVSLSSIADLTLKTHRCVRTLSESSHVLIAMKREERRGKGWNILTDARPQLTVNPGWLVPIGADLTIGKMTMILRTALSVGAKHRHRPLEFREGTLSLTSLKWISSIQLLTYGSLLSPWLVINYDVSTANASEARFPPQRYIEQ
jgi:hypothetical protein